MSISTRFDDQRALAVRFAHNAPCVLAILLVRYIPRDHEWETKPVPDKYRLDERPHLCVDQEKTPELALIGPSIVTLKQGSKYQEQLSSELD